MKLNTMNDPVFTLDPIRDLFCNVQLHAVRVFISQAQKYSNYKYLSLDIFGELLIVSCADNNTSENTVPNPYYNGCYEEE